MNRFSIIFLVVLAVFAAGCSKNVETEKKPVVATWVYDESLLVPIQFGVAEFGVKVKSAFNDLDELSGEKLGVVAVDPLRLWPGEDGTRDESAVCLENEVVICEYDESKGRYMLKFDQPRYYPYQSVCNFSFFAYYKGNNENSPVYEADRVRIPITEGCWGNQDLVYARADADTLYVKYSNALNPFTGEPYGYVPAVKDEDATAFYTGFNASYIRYIAKDKPSNDLNHTYQAHLPTLNFNHPATNIKFVAVLDESNPTGQDVVPTITSVGIKGEEIHVGADFNIVHKDGQQEGAFDVSGYEKGMVMLTDEQGSDEFAFVPTLHGTHLGDGFFFQPISADSPLTLVLTVDNGMAQETIEVDINNHVAFKPGFFYTYELRIYRSIEMQVTVASVAPWLDGWGDAGVTPDSIGKDDSPSLNM